MEKNEILVIGKTETMTSLEIAEVTGKNHAHVMRDIRALLDQGVAKSNFGLGSYKDKNKQERPCYELTWKGCLILASGYDACLREKIINRWEELETKERERKKREELEIKEHEINFPVPKSFSQALLLAAKQQEQIEQQQLMLEVKETTIAEQSKVIEERGEQIAELSRDILEMKPKVSYYDMILNNKSTVAVTQIAQDYGMSAKAFNKTLFSLHIQHKVNGQWILYSEHLPMGYVQSKSIDIKRKDGTTFEKLNTEWTQKGRLFLYDKLKSNGIISIIERH